MKRFFLASLTILALLGAVFAYLLYQEGAFETRPTIANEPPFQMKCEAGKCAAGKCGAGS